MNKELIKTRTINGEKYNYFLHVPDYVGEKGCCGIEIQPYISIETPENGFGYTDTLLYDCLNDTLYTLHRNLPNWIKKTLFNTYKILAKMYL